MKFHKPPIIHPGPVTLKVTDLSRALDFYKNIIGLKVLNTDVSSASLTADGETELLILEDLVDPESVTEKVTGLFHFALLVSDRRTLGTVMAHLLDEGVLQGASDHLVSEALYLSDPDGHGIEIYRDRPSEEWHWEGTEVEMATKMIDTRGVLRAAEGTDWQGLPDDTVMGHVHLSVAELAETARFYTEGLGLKIVSHYGGQALFLSDGGYHHHIGLNTWQSDGAKPASSEMPGLKTLSIIFPDESSREEAVSRLEDLGADVKVDPEAISAVDPSGIRVTFDISDHRPR